MTDLRDLYQAVILDHNKKPRNFGRLSRCTHEAHGHNPLCGDDYEILVLVEDNVVQDISFDGSGCAISKAAASLMTSKVKGKPVSEALQFVEEFRGMLVGDLDDAGREHLGHLKVFEGVAQLPNRIKCAALPWHTLNAALTGSQAASTEGSNDEWEGE